MPREREARGPMIRRPSCPAPWPRARASRLRLLRARTPVVPRGPRPSVAARGTGLPAAAAANASSSTAIVSESEQRRRSRRPRACSRSPSAHEHRHHSSAARVDRVTALRENAARRTRSASSRRFRCWPFTHSSFCVLNTAGSRRPSRREHLRQFVERNGLLAVVRPAEQREEVHHALGHDAGFAERLHGRRAVAPESRLPSGPRIHRRRANTGGAAPSAMIRQLARRVRDVVVAARRA